MSNRKNGTGCPFCSHRRICEETSLQQTHPNLTKEFHLLKNFPLTPISVSIGSPKKIWWKCFKNHEWQCVISKRSNGNGKCPFCSCRKVSFDNNLTVTHPDLIKEWSSKNGVLAPQYVTCKYRKKTWWRCRFNHEWEASPVERTRGSGCPSCKPSISRIELRLFCELKSLFEKARQSEMIDGYKFDIYVPEINLAIEVDGFYWHKSKFEFDLKKSNAAIKHGVGVVRVREDGLEMTSKNDLVFSQKMNDFCVVDLVLRKIMILNKGLEPIVLPYLRDKQFKGVSEYLERSYQLCSPTKELSLAKTNPNLALEWETEKNGNLTPSDVAPCSNRKVWWGCEKKHIWIDSINHRSAGRGCPYCHHKRPSKELNLLQNNPVLASQWSDKNKGLTSDCVLPYSMRKVWWVCPNGHEWKASINNRNRKNRKGTECPYCQAA